MIELNLKQIADVKRLYTGDVVIRIVAQSVQNDRLDKLYQAVGKSLKGYVIRMLKPKIKRSLDANSYLWVLCDKIAQKIGQTKVYIYRNAIKEVGAFTDVSVAGKSEADSLISGWEHNGIGWFAEPVDMVGDNKIIRLYYGSSTYDSKQMASLIDEVVSYCKDFEIEYLPPVELERMKAAWGETAT